MEIKVGQWARGYCTESEVGRVVIGKITKMVDNCLVINDDYWLVNGYGNKIKTADKLEDLLEIGDIVHFKTLYGTGELIIKTEDELNYLKFCVFNKEMIVTAIELHENRVAYRF